MYLCVYIYLYVRRFVGLYTNARGGKTDEAGSFYKAAIPLASPPRPTGGSAVPVLVTTPGQPGAPLALHACQVSNEHRRCEDKSVRG